MSEVFISYRRDDSSDVTGRIYDHLTARFGQAQIFKDVESIQLGADFREIISNAVGKCNLLLVIIGDDWLSITDEAGGRRIDSPNDYVNLEIKTALSRDIPVIPVLVGGASMPSEHDLPESLRELAFRNVIQVRPDPDFRNDIVRLSDRLAEQIETKAKAKAKAKRSGCLGLIFNRKLFVALLVIVAIFFLLVAMAPDPEPVEDVVAASPEATTAADDADLPTEDDSAAADSAADDAAITADVPNSQTDPDIDDPSDSTALSAVVLSGAKSLANKTKVAETQD